MTESNDWGQKFHWLYGLEEYLRYADHPQFDKYMNLVEAILHGNNWAIRDLILEQVAVGKSETTEQFINTIMLYHLHEGLLDDIGHHQLLQYVSSCIDDAFIKNIADWSEVWGEKANLTDHFSRGQMQSKTWLVAELEKIIDNAQLGTVLMYGGWYATVAELLFDRFTISKYYNLDLDREVMQVADDFNRNRIKRNQFQSLICDVNKLVYDDGTTVLPDNTIVKPTVVINTSCEHMTDEWFYNLPDGQFVVLQTNNYFENEQHINCVNNVQEALEKYQFSEVFYSGEIDAMLYYRYMIIGIK